MTRITVLNGPSLNMLGVREPEVYGPDDYASLCETITSFCKKNGIQLEIFQFDLQGEIVRAINDASGISDGLVINPGGYSHTSVAVLDAMTAFRGPVVEVHISQIHNREDFRARLLTARGADVVISGAGFAGYTSAIHIITDILRRKD
ncbi:3-dehydroquinate dehydratase [Candidatus Fermentibacteria bacterium]|nr:MAG: 3-dehydroquinate dehydratase [Candidatus Fermentibacteria bacterium]